MRLRRLGADLLDLALVFPWALTLSTLLFWLGNELGRRAFASSPLWEGVDPLLSMRLLLACLLPAWAFIFVLVRAAGDTSAGEAAFGLVAPARRSAGKRWLRALLSLDAPLGWFLPARPVDRLLGTAPVRDRSRSALEALGALHRARPFTVVGFSLGVAVAFGGLSVWRDNLERHHRRVFSEVLAVWDGFCDQALSSDQGRAWVRAAAWSRWLAPAVYDEQAPLGSAARAELQQAMAFLDGPCGALRIGHEAPAGEAGAQLDRRRHPALLAQRAPGLASPAVGRSPQRESDPCQYHWLSGSPVSPDLACGTLRVLGSRYGAVSADGKQGTCAVYENEGRITAVLAQCEK